MDIFALVLPIILLVLLGNLVARFGLLAPDEWSGVESLSYRILIPTLIINSIYNSDLSLGQAGNYVAGLYISVAVLGLLTLALRPVLRRAGPDNPVFSTLFQLSTRWNALIPLPIAAAVYGGEGLALVTVAMAVLIPVINVVNIIILAMLSGKAWNALNVLRTIVSNPMVIGSAIGLILNASGIKLPDMFETTLSYVSRAALPVGLLCVGAGFDVARLLRPGWSVVWVVFLKLVFAPAMIWAMAPIIGLTLPETVCVILIVMAPAAANGYVVARKMGGDTALYANAMAWQLVATIVAVPVVLALIGV